MSDASEYRTSVQGTGAAVGTILSLTGAALAGVWVVASVSDGAVSWVAIATLLGCVVGAFCIWRFAGQELVVDGDGLRVAGLELSAPLIYEFGSTENMGKRRSCSLSLVFYTEEECPLLLSEVVSGAPPQDWPVAFEIDYPPDVQRGITDLVFLVRFLERHHPQ